MAGRGCRDYSGDIMPRQFAFTDSERLLLDEQCAITIDDNGDAVLTGLTLKETEELMAHRRQSPLARRKRPPKRLRELEGKHEMAPTRAVAAIMRNRNENRS